MDKNTWIALAIVAATLAFVLYKPASVAEEKLPPQNRFAAPYGSPLLDGLGDDEAWQTSPWMPLDQTWIGTPPAPADFSGRYKLLWDEANLYVLAEITDDSLTDTHPDGLTQYWDDDCLEIFLDEDASGGNHQYSYNAFAYHIALNGRVVDLKPDHAAGYFDGHCFTRRTTVGNTSVWEVAVQVYDGNQYTDGAENIPKLLGEGKKMGFALAYCDNDHSPERENFMGNVLVVGPDKNQGWINADVFGRLTLVKQ